jgi:hypothetical protein
MATISKLILTHTGLGPLDPRTQTNLQATDGFSIYFTDVVGDLDNSQNTRSQAQPTQLTYRAGGENTVTLEMTDLVEKSYNTGAISKLIASGHLTASLEGAVNSVEGESLFAFDPSGQGLDDADPNDQGIRIKGKEGNGYVDLFYDNSNNALRVISHPPTNLVNDADDADMYFLTSAGYEVGNDRTGGGEFIVNTGKGFDSNAIDEDGLSGGNITFSTGDGGLFGGGGGDFTVELGSGHKSDGGRIELIAGNSALDSDGGSVILNAGNGDGAGNAGGNIELVVGTGANGSSIGELIIDHLANGVLHMVGNAVKSTGTDFAPNFYQGKEIVNVANAQNLTSMTVTVPIAGLVNGGSSIVVSLMFVGGVGGQFTVAQTPYVFEIDGNNNQFTVALDITNNGNATDIAIAYSIKG